MAHGTDQAIFGLGDANEATDIAANITAHEADTSTHGVAVVAGTADITTHAALTTGVHGAGASTVATAADIATHAGLDLAAAVHGFKGVGKHLADGITEQVAVNEVKVVTVSGGAENDVFKLTVGGLDSAAITMPAGGFANLTAAAIDTALAGGTLGWATADCVVSGAAGGPFTLTFGGALAATNVGNMTVTNATGAAAGTVTDDGSGASVVGAAAALTITVTGIAVGDSLAPVVVYATKASIATQVLRAAADFTIGAGQVTVAANYVNNSGNQYLFEWVDLT